jgi:photosystem II stability/assembly factor-like uncharacterized protein
MSLNSPIFAFLAIVSLLSAFPARIAAQDFSPIMPLASNAVLLDITAAANRLVTAGAHGHVLYSDDNGIGWQQARVPTMQMLTAIDFVDAQHGWTVGHDGLILASDDGGESWHMQRDGLAVQNQYNLAKRDSLVDQVTQLKKKIKHADESSLAQLESTLEDAEMELEDAQQTISEALFTSPLMDVWFKDVRTGWAVGAFGTFLTTQNGGQDWHSQEFLLDNPDAFHLNTIAGDGGERIFIAGEGGVMFRSIDGGETWETLDDFYEGSWFGAVFSPQHDTLLVFGLRGNLYRSNDFGLSWEQVKTGSAITLSGGTASAAGEIVLAGGEGTVLLNTNDGRSFVKITTEDRLSLSSGISHNGRIVVVGQGGISSIEGATQHESQHE